MAMNQATERYSLSLFTFASLNNQKPYYDFCNFHALALLTYSLTYHELEPLYSELTKFSKICKQLDPKAVVQNGYTKQVLGYILN